MNYPCRVTSDLREHERLTDLAEQKQAMVDVEAQKIFNEVTGEVADDAHQFWQFMESMDDRELRDTFGEYLARLWAAKEKGITDDRHIIAREYLEGLVKAWCEQQAEENLE